MSDNGLELFQQLLTKARAQTVRGHKRERPAVLTAAEEAEHRYQEVYRPESYLARYWCQVCDRCGSAEAGLEGVYEVRKHPRFGDRITRRLSGVAALNTALPRQQPIIKVEHVPVCMHCVHELGFEVPSKEVIHAQAGQPQP